MPDFERITRKLEMDMAETPEQQAYVRGKHEGLSTARKQVLVVVALAFIAYGYLHTI